MINITVSIHKGDGESDDYKSAQFFDCPIIPRVGEYVCVSSSRNSSGNYNETGKPEKKFDGIVDHVDYFYEQRGIDSHSNKKTLYVDIYLKEAYRGGAPLMIGPNPANYRG